MLNTAYDYGMTQQVLCEHMEKSELTLAPMQKHIVKYQEILKSQASVRMMNILSENQQAS